MNSILAIQPNGLYSVFDMDAKKYVSFNISDIDVGKKLSSRQESTAKSISDAISNAKDCIETRWNRLIDIEAAEHGDIHMVNRLISENLSQYVSAHILVNAIEDGFIVKKTPSQSLLMRFAPSKESMLRAILSGSYFSAGLIENNKPIIPSINFNGQLCPMLYATLDEAKKVALPYTDVIFEVLWDGDETIELISIGVKNKKFTCNTRELFGN